MAARILIVEDEPILSREIARCLEQGGCEIVGSARSGEQAAELAKETRPDLVLMDVRLSGEMDGIESADRIRACVDAAIVYVTGHSDPALVERAKLTQPYGFIVKPVSDGELLRTVEIALYKHRMEHRVRESEERYRLLAENSLTGICLIQDGCFAYINERFAGLLEFEPDELLGEPFWKVVVAEDTEKIRSMGRSLLGGQVVPPRQQFRAITRKGDVRWLEAWATRIEHGARPAILVNSIDITDRKRSEELLVQSERLKAVADISGGVSHNFNNLLQIVMGSAQLAAMNMETGNESDVRANLDEILKSCRMGADTVKRLQDFANARNDKSFRGGRVFDLSRTASHALDMSKTWWKTNAEKNGIEIQVNRYLTGGCYLKGKENEVFEVIINLIKNSVEALPHGGEITIRTFIEADMVVLQVIDDGVGISKGNLDKVFEPFFTTKGYEGTGMGLASAYGIVHRHRGHISVTSREGRGTIFTVTFPFNSELTEPPAAEVSEFHRKLRILVVDDQEPLLRTLAKGLEKFGQTVVVARSGAQGLNMLDDTSVDLVICDLGMPGMNGWSVAKALKDRYEKKGIPRPPLIVLTGWGDRVAEEDSLGDLGVDAVVSKPVDLANLMRQIERVMRNRA